MARSRSYQDGLWLGQERAMHAGTTPAGPLFGPEAQALENIVEDVVNEILRN